MNKYIIYLINLSEILIETKNPTNLKPDSWYEEYVKFIRFAQWKIKQKKSGIVAFITNNYYLDGITFRGMRYSLQKDFDEILR